MEASLSGRRLIIIRCYSILIHIVGRGNFMFWKCNERHNMFYTTLMVFSSSSTTLEILIYTDLNTLSVKRRTLLSIHKCNDCDNFQSPFQAHRTGYSEFWLGCYCVGLLWCLDALWKLPTTYNPIGSYKEGINEANAQASSRHLAGRHIFRRRLISKLLSKPLISALWPHLV